MLGNFNYRTDTIEEKVHRNPLNRLNFYKNYIICALRFLERPSIIVK